MRASEEKKLIQASVMVYLAQVPDPRKARTREHPLINVLVIALLAVLCGADSFAAIERFGKSKLELLSQLLDLKSGIPSHDTFGRVFACLDPEALQSAFREWVASLVESTDGQVVAIDGKSLRRSFREAGNKAFVHMVSAWATSNRLVLGQIKTDDKSNEITAIPKLLKLLKLDGATVTIDAMGCQKEITKTIQEAGADYLIAVKDNQPTLLRAVIDTFASAAERSDHDEIIGLAETEDKPRHGRLEKRRCLVCSDASAVAVLQGWESVKALVLIESERTVGDKTTVESHYYIASKASLSADEALAAKRSHWGIENGLHWVLDVAYREDDCRVRSGFAAENFAVLRHITLNLLKAAKANVGIKIRRQMAGWDDRFLLEVLCGGQN